MSGLVMYMGDGQSYRWPIPFPYIEQSEVGVKTVSEDGQEKRLVYGRDYTLEYQRVIYLAQKGARLVIWQDGVPPTPQALAKSANTEAPGPVYSVQSVQSVQAEMPDLSEEYNKARELLLSESIKLRAEMDDRVSEKITELLAGATQAIEYAAARALDNIREELAGISREKSAASEMMASTLEEASRAAGVAQAATAQLNQARSVTDNAAITAQGWANASAKSADESWKASCHAWDAATQASIHAVRPGVSSVHSIADIHACSPGIFIINPHLTHTPTPFFGVWPAKSIDDMQWDAVFFISPHLYPDDPRLPPKKPEKPEPDPVVATGSGDEWLPCNHNHLNPAPAPESTCPGVCVVKKGCGC